MSKPFAKSLRCEISLSPEIPKSLPPSDWPKINCFPFPQKKDNPDLVLVLVHIFVRGAASAFVC